MHIDHRYQILARELNARFRPKTVERHWRKAQKALNKRIKAARAS